MNAFFKLTVLLLTALLPLLPLRAQTWSDVGGGTNDWVSALIEYNGQLYAGGYGLMTQAGGLPVNNIARWNGTKWDSLGGGVSARVHDFAVYNSTLFVAMDGGLNINGKSVESIAQWDGVKWDSVGNHTTSLSFPHEGHALAVYNSELYLGGEFDNIGGNFGYNHIARWDGVKWDSLGSGTNNWVLAFAQYDTSLYIGGAFVQAGGMTVNHIARWSMPVGINEAAQDRAALQAFVYPNPFNIVTTFYISSPVHAIDQWSIAVYDIAGRPVKNIENISNQRVRFPKGDLSTGIYLYRILRNNLPVAAGKLIIQ